MSKYVVHINLKQDYSSIHFSDCRFSRPPGTKTINTKWEGPFESYGEAYIFACNLELNFGPYDCSFCEQSKEWRAEEKIHVRKP